MRYEFSINDIPCEQLGVTIGRGSVDALHATVQRKDYITNENASINGVQYLTDNEYMPKIASRDVSIVVYLEAASKESYWTAYNRLCNLLNAGVVRITEMVYEDGLDDTDTYVVYRLLFTSCPQFRQYNRRTTKLLLHLTEPDPTNRNI